MHFCLRMFFDKFFLLLHVTYHKGKIKRGCKKKQKRRKEEGIRLLHLLNIRAIAL